VSRDQILLAGIADALLAVRKENRGSRRRRDAEAARRAEESALTTNDC